MQIKIKDNIICLGNRYSNVIKLGNIDYNMLSNSEQDSIENVLIQTALAIDYPIQFFSTTEFIDTSKVISLIKQNKTNKIKRHILYSYCIPYLSSSFIFGKCTTILTKCHLEKRALFITNSKSIFQSSYQTVQI